jgi:hypothetical protein
MKTGLKATEISRNLIALIFQFKQWEDREREIFFLYNMFLSKRPYTESVYRHYYLL